MGHWHKLLWRLSLSFLSEARATQRVSLGRGTEEREREREGEGKRSLEKEGGE